VAPTFFHVTNFENKNMKNKLFRVITLFTVGITMWSPFGLNSQTTGAALSLDGVNDFILINHHAAFNFSTAFTLEAWIKTSQQDVAHIINKEDDSFYFAINGSGATGNKGKLSFFCNGLTSAWLNGTTTVADGNWHHVAATYNGSLITMYVDGAIEQTLSVVSGAPATGTTQLQVGYRFVNQNNIQWFEGAMDEMRIWNVARSACEINSYMKCEIPTTANGLVANYHFNQGTANGTNTINTLMDATGVHTGTLYSFGLMGSTSNWMAPGGVTSGSTTPMPQLIMSAAALNPTICVGESATLTVNGAQNYTWSTGATTSSLVVNPTSNATYTVVGKQGDCEGTAAAQIVVNACLGLDKIRQHAYGMVFPNPASNQFFIELPAPADIVITDAVGKVILMSTYNQGQTTMSCDTWPQGIYFIQIKGGQGSEMIKWVKE